MRCHKRTGNRSAITGRFVSTATNNPSKAADFRGLGQPLR